MPAGCRCSLRIRSRQSAHLLKDLKSRPRRHRGRSAGLRSRRGLPNRRGMPSRRDHVGPDSVNYVGLPLGQGVEGFG